MEHTYAFRPCEDLALITILDLDYGEEMEITLGRTDTVSMLKSIYSANRNFGKFSAFNLTFNGRTPKDDEKFESMESNGPYFFLASLTPEAMERTKIPVTVVNGNGREPSTEFLYPTKILRVFKEKFCKKKNRFPSYLVFFFKGKEMSDLDTGHALGITAGSIIEAHARRYV